jgi:hypothetical protein
MIIDLVPEFLAAVTAPDPLEAYHRYLDTHRHVLAPYWHNYILDPESSQAEEIVRRAIAADRTDLHDLLSGVNVRSLAEQTLAQCEEAFEIDRPVDLCVMVGVGGANAGELVVSGRGIAFVCLEHFTGRPNTTTHGMGLTPDHLRLWIAHEVAHTVRYTSPRSRSELAKIVVESGGNYDYWETGSRTSLRELLVNEGLAVAASLEIAPDFEIKDHLGYTGRQYRRLRQLEAFLRSAVHRELGRCGVGYRLRYLAGGTRPAARLVAGKVLPERSGYYLGHRMVEAFVAEQGIAEGLRASAIDCLEADARRTGAQPA